jgi:hypothetical protein
MATMTGRTNTRGRSPLGGGRTSNPAPTATTNGTMGGQTRQTTAAQSAGAMRSGVNDATFYLWILVAFEAFLIGYLRHSFRRHHGG